MRMCRTAKFLVREKLLGLTQTQSQEFCQHLQEPGVVDVEVLLVAQLLEEFSGQQQFVMEKQVHLVEQLNANRLLDLRDPEYPDS